MHASVCVRKHIKIKREKDQWPYKINASKVIITSILAYIAQIYYILK